MMIKAYRYKIKQTPVSKRDKGYEVVPDEAASYATKPDNGD